MYVDYVVNSLNKQATMIDDTEFTTYYLPRLVISYGSTCLTTVLSACLKDVQVYGLRLAS